ncbi:Asp/Glu racemase [Chromatiales bacterium (ex Bugula neritina AB1)]|nr:Asp/Glu racemase [Chromatiales bacterium (ex Bugula neritina AB1)]
MIWHCQLYRRRLHFLHSKKVQMDSMPSIEQCDFETDDGLGSAARIGLIVLQTDQTIEHEFSGMVRAPGIALYHSRIPNAMEVTPQTLGDMKLNLPTAAALLPAQFNFDAIGYACTSGATMIGEDQVEALINEIHPNAKVSNPISACKAAMHSLGLKRIALITPYAPQVTLAMQSNLNAAGFQINTVASFNQSDDFTVARITSESILRSVLKAGSNKHCDGVFVSCTSLRTLEVITTAESQLKKPVIASNQALAWHLLRLARQNRLVPGCGQLFENS